jgi:hypothetical protein
MLCAPRGVCCVIVSVQTSSRNQQRESAFIMSLFSYSQRRRKHITRAMGKIANHNGKRRKPPQRSAQECGVLRLYLCPSARTRTRARCAVVCTVAPFAAAPSVRAPRAQRRIKRHARASAKPHARTPPRNRCPHRHTTERARCGTSVARQPAGAGAARSRVHAASHVQPLRAARAATSAGASRRGACV